MKENEKKLKGLEAEFLQMQKDIAAAERARRSIETERDELLEELNNNTAAKSAVAEERKRYEAQLANLEDELEEERSQTEITLEKVRLVRPHNFSTILNLRMEQFRLIS